MPRYEYKVVPAPAKGRKGKGIKGAEARFSYTLQELMNGLAGHGWEYQRAETLPSVERSGLTRSTTEWRNVLVFRRLRETDAEAFAPELLPAPADAAAAVAVAETASDEPDENAPSDPPAATPSDAPEPTAPHTAWDNGVEDTSDVRGVGTSLEKLAAARNSSKTRD